MLPSDLRLHASILTSANYLALKVGVGESAEKSPSFIPFTNTEYRPEVKLPTGTDTVKGGREGMQMVPGEIRLYTLMLMTLNLSAEPTTTRRRWHGLGR